jgi:glycine/D-amino acid oxidase-like deaminating enzyme
VKRAYDVLIVGAGIFGVTAALELRSRGSRVALLDQGVLPNIRGASADINRVMRIDYGSDEVYAALAEQSRAGWLRWNAELFREEVYQETGMVFLTRSPMLPGSYEYESFQRLSARGFPVERLDSAEIARRFPAWSIGAFVDGYLNPHDGYVDSRQAMEALLTQARRQGVEIYQQTGVTALLSEAGRTAGVRTTSGERLIAGDVVIAAGAWTPVLLPELRPLLRSTGQPVFSLQPSDPTLFAPPRFVVFSADSSRTGWYGFPIHPRAGVLKIANHGPGWPVHPDDERRAVPSRERERFQAFLAECLPPLIGARLVEARCCLYCDTPDGDFLIARHPERPGLTVATGDSGHAFKFAPILGRLIAETVEGAPTPYHARFGWRTVTSQAGTREVSRYRGEFDSGQARDEATSRCPADEQPDDEKGRAQ